MASVAFLGTGMLGGAMVEGMLRRGDLVTVWNRTEAKARALEALGATVAATPGDAVAAAERVHMTFSDDEVVDAMLALFTPRLQTGTLVLDHTTASPRGTKARIDRMKAAGVQFLHAPVFMSPEMARDSVGLILASGPQAVYDAALDTLEARLATRRFLFGNRIVETDWRLFCTLIRFDAVYHGHFKCNVRRILDYPNLQQP